MNQTENVVAKKYATAFLNLYKDKISLDDYHNLKTTADYFKKNHKFFFLLNTPTIPLQRKRTTLISLLEDLKIPTVIAVLVELVLKHQRIFLLPTIFNYLVTVYEQREKIVPFTFYSSHALEKKQIEIAQSFLTKKINASITYTCITNENLIAGIRLQSNFFLWEYSIAKQLNAIHKTILNSKGY